MMILRVISFLLAVIAALAVTNRAAEAQVPVTTCGTVVDNGYLTGDLDCRGMDLEFPVLIHPKGSLDLGGFTLYVGQNSILCGTFETDPEGNTYLSATRPKCTISNGVLRDSTNSAISGHKVIVKNVSILDSGDRGIQAVGGSGDRIEMIDSTISGSASFGVLATVVVLKGSTITGNKIGIIAKNAKLRDSSVTGNGTDPACTSDCVDLKTVRRPRLKNSTCNRSRGNNNGDWSVCTYDE